MSWTTRAERIRAAAFDRFTMPRGGSGHIRPQSTPRVRLRCGIPLASIAARRLSMRVARSQEDNDRNLCLTKPDLTRTMRFLWSVLLMGHVRKRHAHVR